MTGCRHDSFINGKRERDLGNLAADLIAHDDFQQVVPGRRSTDIQIAIQHQFFILMMTFVQHIEKIVLCYEHVFVSYQG